MNIEELKQRAAAGDAEAMCDLGMAYFHGEGVEENKEKAVELLQASIDAWDEYAPFLLGQMYIYGHIADENAGYNGMRLFGIAARRGAEGVEKEIAEHRLNFAKSSFERVFDEVDSSLCPQDFLNYLEEKVDAFIIKCQDGKINKPEQFSWLSRNRRCSNVFYLKCFVENPPTVKNKHFFNYMLANVLELSLNDEPFEFTEKAAILRKAAELVWGIDAPWVEWALYLLYRRFAEINLAVGNIEKAADIYMILATQMDICYISQFDVDDYLEDDNLSQKEVDRMLEGEECYYNMMLKLLYCYLQIEGKEDDAQGVLDRLSEVLKEQRTHFSPTADEWLLGQLKNSEEDKESGTVNAANLLGHHFFGYFFPPYIAFFDKMTTEWNGETIESGWSRERFELIELVIKKMPAYFELVDDSAFWMMVLHKLKAQYYMLTRRYKLVEQGFLYAMGFFGKAVATQERETVVLPYVRGIRSLWQFYTVQRMDDKKAKLVSYLDVLTPEDFQNEEVTELKNMFNS